MKLRSLIFLYVKNDIVVEELIGILENPSFQSKLAVIFKIDAGLGGIIIQLEKEIKKEDEEYQITDLVYKLYNEHMENLTSKLKQFDAKLRKVKLII